MGIDECEELGQEGAERERECGCFLGRKVPLSWREINYD
jgi:hypothetical protein